MPEATAPQQRRIERIRIRDFLAIEEVDIVVGDGLIITGRTGSGKTAVLDALQAVFDIEQCTRTKKVRLGEDQAEVVLVMSDRAEVTRKINDAQAERPRLLGPNGKPLGAPVERLKAMAPALLLNPIRFVEMTEPQKAKVLADVFPVELSQTELEAICGEDVDLREVEPHDNGLARANQAHAIAYKTRTGANGELKQAQAARDAERKKIPVGFDPAVARALSSESIAQELGRIEHHNRLVVDGASQMTKLEGEEKNLTTSIENFRQLLAEKEAQLADVKARLQKGRDWLGKNKHIDPAPTQATLKGLDQQRMYLQCHDTAEAYEQQCQEIAARALRLDAIVTTLKALPGELLRRARIPIKGMTLEDGVVHINGLPIDNLSKGEQYRVAATVAAAGVKDLKVVCIDGAEAMSETARNQLIDDLKAEGIQVFLTVADECDFNIADLEGNPVQAKVIIPPRTQPMEEAIARGAPATQQPRALHSPRAPGRSPVSVAARTEAPAAVTRATPTLFEAPSEEESLFGEPSI